MKIKYSQLKKIISEDQAQTNQTTNGSNDRTVKALSKPLKNISNLIDRLGDPNTIIEVLRCITNSESMMDAFGKLKQILAKKNTEAKQAAAAQNVEEGIGDRFASRANAWAQGTKAAVKNIAGSVQKKVTGQTNIKHQDVYGSMQTGKFGTLIQRYIGKIQSLKNEMSKFATKTQDETAKKQVMDMIGRIDNFVKVAGQSLASAKSEIKAAGGNRQPNAQNQVNENIKITLTVGQIRKLISEANEGFFGKAKKYGSGMAQSVADRARAAGRNATDFAKQAKTDISQGAKNLMTTGDTRGAAGPARFAADLSRIIGELEMDLKDLGWSERHNPQLAQVIKNMEGAANEIHGRGEKGHTTTWDKVRHKIGNAVGTTVSAATQGVVINSLFGPLKQFMSPRMYAALVAFCTVLLRWYLKNFANRDVNADKREDTAAKQVSESSITCSYVSSRILNEGVPPDVLAQAVVSAGRAYIANDSRAGGGEGDMSTVLTGKLGQKIHIGSDGMPELMECKIRGRLIKIAFKDGGGNFDYKSITDSAGNLISLETLSGGSSAMREQATRDMIEKTFASATGKSIWAWKTYIQDGFSPDDIISGAKSPTIGAMADRMAGKSVGSDTVQNIASGAVKKTATSAANTAAGASSSPNILMGADADEDAF